MRDSLEKRTENPERFLSLAAGKLRRSGRWRHGDRFFGKNRGDRSGKVVDSADGIARGLGFICRAIHAVEKRRGCRNGVGPKRRPAPPSKPGSEGDGTRES